MVDLAMSAQVPPTPDSLLRTAPRQERSERRINLILDTAAGLFDEIGYDATTTKHVADRANIAVGSIYHWFPDKTALATALAERYLAELLALYDIELTDDPTETTADLITRVSAVLAAFVKSNPAFITLLVDAFAPGGESSPGERLRVGMHVHVRALIEARAPGTPVTDAIAVTDTIVSVTHALLAFAARFTGSERQRRLDELSYVLTAYVVAKFPAAHDPVWTNPYPLLAPVAVARPVQVRTDAEP
jgi:AcrR family transcriptional regulator